MEKSINLLSLDGNSVHELKKNIANMEVFLESVYTIVDECNDNEEIGFLRLDIAKFKQVNDNYGYEVGDYVIWEIYSVIKHQTELFENNSRVKTNNNQRSYIARAHGDEFILCIKANRDEVEELAKSIIKEVSLIDYTSIGCLEKKGCYIGINMTKKSEDMVIRLVIDQTIDALTVARNKGINHYAFFSTSHKFVN